MGFDGIRIWPRLDTGPQLMNGDGRLRPDELNRLRFILDKVRVERLIVDVTFAYEHIPGMSPATSATISRSRVTGPGRSCFCWRSPTVAAQPDWILVTSWNKFWENTHIEPSVLFGRRYQGRTRAWSKFFRRQGLGGPVPSVQPQPP